MIRLWLSRETSVPIREQLSAQFMLGILSRRLRPGERLPSVRQLAQRLRIHPNTVSAVYQDLSARGWVKVRRGSGVFVSDKEDRGAGETLSDFVRVWTQAAVDRGFPVEALRAELGRLQAKHCSLANLVVVDPDGELARILATEISTFTARRVGWMASSDWPSLHDGDKVSRVFVNSGRLSEVSAVVPQHLVTAIRVKSMEDVVAGQARPPSSTLMAIVSRSESILSWAATLLSALGFSPDAVLLRNPAASGWDQGLSACELVAADVCAASELPAKLHPVVFQVVSEDSLAEMNHLVTR